MCPSALQVAGPMPRVAEYGPRLVRSATDQPSVSVSNVLMIDALARAPASSAAMTANGPQVFTGNSGRRILSRSYAASPPAPLLNSGWHRTAPPPPRHPSAPPAATAAAAAPGRVFHSERET